MKKTVLATLLFLAGWALSTPVSALPGKSLEQTRSWLKNHSFLPSNLVQDTSFEGSYWVKRSLTNGKEILFAVWTEGNKVIANELRVSFKASVGQEFSDGLNLLERKNEKAQLFFSTLYGPEVASDFAAAKLVHEGKHYFFYDVHTNAEKRYHYPGKQRVFFGKKYNYVVSLSYPQNQPNPDPFYWAITVYEAKDTANPYASIQETKRQEAKFLKEEAERVKQRPARLDL